MPLHGSGKVDALTFSARDFARAKSRPPAQTGRMTLKKLDALIMAGYGQGHLHRYKPWLRVTKRDYSPSSLIGHLPLPELKRLHHFRAQAEQRVLLLLRWLGALDMRDQYPFWPWSHAHPLFGLPGVESWSMRGLVEISRDIGIKHENYIGTDLPYVATIDILATWKAKHGGYVLTAYDCKPEQIVKESPPGAFVHRRILLHRAYCKEAQIDYRLTHAERLPRLFLVNLDALYPLLGPGELTALRQSADYCDLVSTLSETAYDRPARVALVEAAARNGSAGDRANLILNTAIWTQDLDHDLRAPLELYEPLLKGGRWLKASLLREWGGTGVVNG